MDTAFRKIDIDAYDEDAFLESELYDPDPRGPAQVLADAKQKQTSVRSSLAKYVTSRDLQERNFIRSQPQRRYRRSSDYSLRKCTIRSRRRRGQGEPITP